MGITDKFGLAPLLYVTHLRNPPTTRLLLGDYAHISSIEEGYTDYISLMHGIVNEHFRNLRFCNRVGRERSHGDIK